VHLGFSSSAPVCSSVSFVRKLLTLSRFSTIAVLGSTGSIGTSCLDVVRQHSDRLRIAGVAAHRSVERLCRQVTEFQPAWAVLGCSSAEVPSPSSAVAGRSSTAWYRGVESLEVLIRAPEITTVVCAMVGAAGLPATWAAVDSGKRVALANKESLVIAGPLIMQRAAETGAQVIPVDSEHSAIFQCLQSGRRDSVERLVLTASGGPFRGRTRSQLEDVTPELALRHPTWQMGPKITIDSATMMNKALEIIEARWLFGLSAERLSVVIHPQSVIHSLVEFHDGSVVAQMSPPDMRLPIQYALLYPERLPGPSRRTDWSRPQSLELLPPDFETFPALQLGFEAARSGGTCGAVLNAANEVAVERFLAGSLTFTMITDCVRDILHHHQFDALPSLPQLLAADRRAREEALRWKS
jgi:1-deoxy-D-xylulose-5-phosphate reductoisomerase